MDISVIICTWNRAESLRKCLESLVHLLIPEGKLWEVIVVNNNSSDATHNVIKSFLGRLPIQEVFESKIGHSIARNSGIHFSQGDLIFFTDDDVLVHENWVIDIYRSATINPDVPIFGGPILPLFEGGCEKIARNLSSSFYDGLLVRKHLGNHPKTLEKDETIFGANMAFRKIVFSTRIFDSRLGLKGNSAIRGEEVVLMDQARRNHDTIFWVPSAVVYHRITPYRLSYAFSLKYFWGIGRTRIRSQWVLKTSYNPFYFPDVGQLTWFSFWTRWAFMLGQLYEAFSLAWSSYLGLKERTLQPGPR